MRFRVLEPTGVKWMMPDGSVHEYRYEPGTVTAADAFEEAALTFLCDVQGSAERA